MMSLLDAICPTAADLTRFARKQPELFALPSKPRQPRRVMMHHMDAGPGPGTLAWGLFKCKKCGATWESHIVTDTQLRRVIPCLVCNV